MQKSELIKKVEKHQRKSLGQVRELISDICIKRKMRTPGSFAGRVNNLSNPPDMEDVRKTTKEMSEIMHKHILKEIHGGRSSKKHMNGSKSGYR